MMCTIRYLYYKNKENPEYPEELQPDFVRPSLR